MKIKNVGGRGKRADFPTIPKRVPIAIESEIDRLIDDLYKSIDRKVELPFSYTPHLKDSTAVCMDILKQKKSARKSLEMFLKWLHPKETIHLDT